jgi:hypothetical protein
MARVSAVIVLIGLPTLFVRQVPLGLIEVVSERGVTLGPLEWNALSSIFRNPNTMSYLAMVGLIAGIGEYVRARTRLSLLLVVINGAGLFLSHSRGALLGAGVALTVLALHRQLSWLGFQCVVVFTASLGVYAFAVLVGSLPGPEVVRSADLSGRLVIWRGGFEAVLAHPLFGLGPGNTAVQIATFVAEPHSGLSPHNSYLRVFSVASSIFGLIIFLTGIYGYLQVGNAGTLIIGSIIGTGPFILGIKSFQKLTPSGVNLIKYALVVYLIFVILPGIGLVGDAYTSAAGLTGPPLIVLIAAIACAGVAFFAGFLGVRQYS